MKKSFLIVTILLVSLIFFLSNAYAHHYQGHYGKEGIKVETKKVDKGIQAIITSDDPEVAKELQENIRYYEEILTYSEYCPYMTRMSSRHHGCMWE